MQPPQTPASQSEAPLVQIHSAQDIADAVNQLARLDLRVALEFKALLGSISHVATLAERSCERGDALPARHWLQALTASSNEMCNYWHKALEIPAPSRGPASEYS